MDNSTRKLVKKVLIDNICLGAVAFPLLILYVSVTPFRRGFFCDDLSIRLPYFKSSAVPTWLLIAYCISLPVFGFVLVEFLHHYYSKSSESIKIFQSKKLLPWVWLSYLRIEEFLFGAACTQLLTQTAKYSIGRLRPHFIQACQPNNGLYCNDPRMNTEYIQNYYCTSTFDPAELNEMRLAFLSGHASFSTYTMLYLAIYLNVRITWKDGKMFKHVLQFFCVLLAFYTGLTRISDSKHHWGDVLAGAVLGAIVAIVTVKYVSHTFTQSNLYLFEDDREIDDEETEVDVGVESISEAKTEIPLKLSEQTAI